MTKIPRTNYLKNTIAQNGEDVQKIVSLQTIENYIAYGTKSLDKTQSSISQMRKIRADISQNFDAFRAMTYELKGDELGNIITNCENHFLYDGQSTLVYEQGKIKDCTEQLYNYINDINTDAVYKQKLKELIPIIIYRFTERKIIDSYDREYQLSKYNISQAHADHLFILTQHLLGSHIGDAGRALFDYYKKKRDKNIGDDSVMNENILIRQDPHVHSVIHQFRFQIKNKIYRILSDESERIFTLDNTK